jgi:hypothetical protein
MYKRQGSGSRRRSQRDWGAQLVTLAEVAMLLGTMVLLSSKQVSEWVILGLLLIVGARLDIRPKVLLEALLPLLGGGQNSGDQSGGACSASRCAPEPQDMGDVELSPDTGPDTGGSITLVGTPLDLRLVLGQLSDVARAIVRCHDPEHCKQVLEQQGARSVNDHADLGQMVSMASCVPGAPPAGSLPVHGGASGGG